MTTTTLTREQAVTRISAPIADRFAYVILTTPDALTAGLPERLTLLPPGWLAYLDRGDDCVLETDNAGAISLAAALFPVAVIITVPKTIPASVLSEALGQEVPPDGSQDLIMLTTDLEKACGWPGPERQVWPEIFLDALDRVDPDMVSAIRAAAI